jgi:cold shock CspA family protein
MRLAGRITDWNDEKGFGFVVPNGGGDRAFVHVNEFQRGSKRSASGDLISYVVATDQRGRLNAKQIRRAGQKIAVPRTPSRVPRAALGAAALALGAALVFFRIIPFLLMAAVTA